MLGAAAAAQAVLRLTALCLIASSVAGPAAAQVAGSVALQNQYLFRGYSISAHRPVAILNLSYDHASGVYASGSAIGVLDRSDNPAALGVIGDIGYGRRISPSLSVDAGVDVTHYFQNPAVSESAGFTQAYVGASGRRFSGHLFYSPNYYASGVQTLYGEIETSAPIRAKIRLSAHLGYLDYLSAPAGFQFRDNQYDWRAGAARQFGRVDVHADISGGGPNPDYYGAGPHAKTSVVVGANVAF